MKIVKILNNNLVYARDEKGDYCIAIGKGIGFEGKTEKKIAPGRVEKLIYMDGKKTTDKLAAQLQEIPQAYFDVATDIVEYAAGQIGEELNKNIYITLTDHINFSVQRHRKGIYFANHILWEIKTYYPTEFLIGQHATKLINKQLQMDFDENEAGFIAMHIVCARYDSNMSEMMDATKLVTQIIRLVETYFGIRAGEDSYSLQRFVTHLRFLVQRIIDGRQWDDAGGIDDEYIDTVRKLYQEEYGCSQEIDAFIQSAYHHKMTGSELAYLTIHIRNIHKGYLRSN